jgi:GT2 family glycosyltransferase
MSVTTSSNTRTTVVVVTWRGRAHLTECLDALAAQTRPHRTVVIDNASDDGSAALLAAHPSAPAVRRLPANTGYAGGIAAALPEVDTEFVAWLNDDAAPAKDWLAELEDALLADPWAAAASARMERADGEPISLGVGLTGDGHGVDRTQDGPVFGFCGGAALLRTGALRRVGGVPAEFFCYYEDTDTSWRLRLAGWSVLSVPSARVTHRHGASTRPGSWLFHRWNERNRLAMLVRCAPARVAVRELARFAALTAVLPVRRLAGRNVPTAANFRLGLRLRVLAELVARLPALVGQRRAITRRSTVSRTAVWSSTNSSG